MDGNNWVAAQGQVEIPGQVMSGEAVLIPGMWGAEDWRTPDCRQRIVNKIMDTLKLHLPFKEQEGLRELYKIAARFEEKVYTAATSRRDYLRIISLKMLTMEAKSKNPMENYLQSNAASNNRNPQDPESESMHSQIHQQGSVELQSSEHVQFQIQQHQQQQAAFQQYLTQQQQYLLQQQQLQQAQLHSIMQLQQNSMVPNQAQQQQQQTIIAQQNDVSNLQQQQPCPMQISVAGQGSGSGSVSKSVMEISDRIAQLQPLQPNAAQDADASGGDWQEEVYQKIKSMNEMYFPDLNELYWRMSANLQKYDALVQQPKEDKFEKLRFAKVLLKRFILFMRTNKNEVQIIHKDSIVEVEKQVVNILSRFGSSLEQGQQQS